MLQAAVHRAPRSLLHLRCCSQPSAAMSVATITSGTATSNPEVAVSISPAGLGRITLCRERQLNALGAEHVEALRSQLLQWAKPGSGVQCVLLDSNNDRSFCSGGDVKAARQAVLDNPYPDVPPLGHHIHRVFEAEYSTVLLTAAHPSLVACCQGIWMGLGFGIAGYAPYRIISDGTIFAMPENAIGLWPDVGFAFKAAHMAQHAGLLLGLSGVRITSPSDLLHYGIATHYIPQNKLQEFKLDLSNKPGCLQQLLQQYSQPPPDAPGPLQRLMKVLSPHMQQLVDTYHAAGCEELQAMHKLVQHLQEELPGLKSHDHQAAELLHHAINGLLYASPRSLAITLQHFVRVHEAVASQQQRQQHGSNGGSNGNSSGHGSGACSQLPPTWQLNVTVNGHNVIGVPDLSALKGVMQMEYRMAVRQVAHEDFIEGVRAALVDKDRHPAWLKSAAAAAASGSVLVQQEHQLRLFEGEAEADRQQQQLPGNRFSVQHLYAPFTNFN